MENFMEHMVKRQKNLFEILGAVLLVIVGLVILRAVLYLRWNSMILAIIVVGIIYVIYKVVSAINVEYEYTITNSELDIDKIINKRSRKRMETVNLRRVDDFGFCGSEKENRYISSGEYEKIYACESKAEGYVFLVYTKDEGKKILFFSPNEKMVEYIEKANIGKIR